MTGAPNLQPLAALLSQHPEECAAVVSVLAADFSPRQGLSAEEAVQDVGFFEPDAGATPERVRAVLDALCAAGFAERDASGDYAIGCHGRYAIARQGAAAWLRARVSEERAK